MNVIYEIVRFVGESTMKSSLLLQILVVLIVVALVALYLVYSSAPHYTLNNFKKTTISILSGNSTLNGSVYLALNQSQLMQGYQYQNNLGNCSIGASKCIGILFVFPSEQNLCFWMINTEMPLQQVWIGSNFTVTYIYNGTPYSKNTVCFNGTYVLEISPNLTINVGNRIVINLQNNSE